MGSFAQRAVGRQQFSQPPERSSGFWYATVFLAMVVLEAMFIAVFFRSRLNGQVILYMTMAIVFLIVWWVGIRRSHAIVYEARQRGRESAAEDDEQISIVLDRLAYVSYAGFTYTCVAVAFAFIAMEQCLART